MQNTRLSSLDFDLGPEIDMLRTTVRGFAEDRGQRTLVAIMQQTLMVMHGKADA